MMADKNNPLLAKFQEAQRKADQQRGATPSNPPAPSPTPKRTPVVSLPKLKRHETHFLGKVMIVESDIRIATMLGQHLRTLKMEPVMTKTGTEALALAEKEVPLLFVIASELSDIASTTLCSRIRVLPGAEQVPILLFSDSDDQQALDAALMVGASEVIAKPFKTSTLTHKIRTLLGQEEG